MIDITTVLETKRFEIGSAVYLVVISEDSATRLVDRDSYSTREEAGFNHGAWRFVSVRVIPIVDGDLIEDADASVSGVEFGMFPKTDLDDTGLASRWIGIDEIIASHVKPGSQADLAFKAWERLGELA